VLDFHWSVALLAGNRCLYIAAKFYCKHVTGFVLISEKEEKER
jgi:hypothetical protein